MTRFFKSLPPKVRRILARWLTEDAKWNEADHPREHGKFAPKGQGQSSSSSPGPAAPQRNGSKRKKVKLHPKEREKIGHEINTLYHSKYSETDVIHIHRSYYHNTAYDYYFIADEFGSYRFIGKRKNEG